ncbi:hypothetical protein K7X08_026146 [Anisodus acutangulus]|uniref:Actin cross-linking n=1 Tax=Anisodus acutangulus TaxID=402998 RepID=A0A9Q1RVK2_9SOLA|nr:hypothetical protein K7X08_026146 [Anisodus acutangulus]
MDIFHKAKAIRLKSHLDKYLVADDDQETTRQSRRHGLMSRKSRWLVELVSGSSHHIRLKNCHSGKYLMASDEPFLLGMTGNKAVQNLPENYMKNDLRIEWEPIRDGFQVKLKAFGGTFLRANGGTPPWRNSVTHDSPGSTHNWILWNVETTDDVPENEASTTGYSSRVSSISSVSDGISVLEMGSPVMSTRSSFSCSPRIAMNLVTKKQEKMDLFYKAKAVRLRSYHEKYLLAEEDEETVIQDRDGASRNATWTVEFINNGGKNNIIRLKSCYGKYLTASNQRFLLGMTGRKVLQTLPHRLDSSIEWEPIREGNQVKLRTKHGQFLRANDSIPPWRNSVTHNIPHRTSTQDWILWDVDVVEILVHSPAPREPPPLIYHEESDLVSESSSPSSTLYSASPASFSRQESEEFVASSLMKFGDGRLIYYHIANEYGEINEGVEGVCIPFKGNSVEELKKTLEVETGLEDITVCTKSSLNGKLYPLRLQLPPNNANMDVVVVPYGII